MESIALERSDIVVGVDTQKDQHVAVALDGVGGRLGEPLVVDATNDGYAAFVSRGAAWLHRPYFRRRLEQVTGAVLIGFGIRLATEMR